MKQVYSIQNILTNSVLRVLKCFLKQNVNIKSQHKWERFYIHFPLSESFKLKQE